MSQLRTVIIDDEEDARELIKLHLDERDDIEIVGEAADGRQAIALIERLKPDLALLDIEMPELSGVQVAGQLKYVPQIIFVTAFDEYAVKAFEIHAADYLLKPYSPKRLFAALDHIKDRLRSTGEDTARYADLLHHLVNRDENPFISRISVKIGGQTHYLLTSDITMIEAADQYVNIHAKNKIHLLRQSMDYFEKALDPKHFFRTHRSYLVNLDQVRSIEQYEPKNLLVHLEGELKAKLSLSRRRVFEEKLRVG